MIASSRSSSPSKTHIMAITNITMNKRALLRCDGSLEEGFRVALEISDRTIGPISEAVGELPPALELIALLEEWRTAYRQSLVRGESRISVESVTIETGSFCQLEDCRNLSRTLETALKNWLSHPSFQEIEQRLREGLNVDDPVEILLRARDSRLYQLPWHRWGFIERYPKAELVLSIPSERLETETRPHDRVRILAILGDRAGIDTDSDRQLLEKTPDSTVMFLVEPSRQVLYRHLWEQPWDILFFAGHSHTSENQGILNINQTEQLSLEDLKYGLKKAINRGLKLAIFNSCDGLGLAHELEQLHIPQFIVMREPVPDRVAQEFLKHFLQAFSLGESLPASVRQAREWLQSLEGDFPCASWLPILFQNPAMEALNWHRLTQPPAVQTPPARTRAPKLRLRAVLALSLLVGCLLLGVRSLGLLQRSELWAYDQMARLQFSRPITAIPDRPKIRVIGITKQDTQTLGQGNVIGDRALAQLITKINRYQPKVVGLDIFRDAPQPDVAGYKQLLNTLGATPHLVLACQMGEDDQSQNQAVPSVAPPQLSSPKAVGYADGLLPDADGIIRRYVLQMAARPGGACASEQSFAWQIAKQVAPEANLNRRLPADFGGYQGDGAEFGEDVILVNYHASSRNIQPYSLQDILYLNTDSELKQLFQDSVVLIGYNLGGSEDTHATPIGQQNGVMIHIHVIRQLLRQTSGFQSWPQWGEMLVIMAAGLMAGLMLWRWRSLRRRLFGAIFLGVALPLISYGAFLQQVWLPGVPVIMGLWVTLGLIGLLEKRLRVLSR
jgi:CHASE2 domain-containing sensor protein